MLIMQKSLFSVEFPDGHIVNILSYVDRMGFDVASCKILTSNLKVLNDLKMMLSSACSAKLSNFLLRYLRILDNRENLCNFDWNEIRQSIVSLLNLQERNEKHQVIKSVLHCQLDSAEAFLRFENKDDLSEDIVCHRLKLLDIFLTYTGENDLNEIFSEEIKFRFAKFFMHLFVNGDARFLPQALALCLIYLKATKHWTLLKDILEEMTDQCLSCNDFVTVFIVILSFFIDHIVEVDTFSSIVETEKFWRALKQCYVSEKCERKHVNYVLKFSISTLRHEVVDDIWNPTYSKSYQSWWKNYFIITEILEEKQIHLILPIFPLISEMLSDPVVQVDAFWILILFQSALEHDSRIVRIKAFLIFLDTRKNSYQNVHFPILLKLFVNTVNDSMLYRKLFKANEFDDFGNSIIVWLSFFESKGKTPFFKLLFSTICEVKWSPIPLYYILDIFIRSRIQPCLEMEVTQQLKGIISNVTHYHNIVIRAAIQCSFIRFVTKICKSELENLTYLFDFVNHFNHEECLLRGVNAWSVLREYLINTINLHSTEKFISENIILLIECDKRSSNRIVLPLARFILLLHDCFSLLDKKSPIYDRMNKMIVSFSSAFRSPYLSTRVQDNYLLLLVGIYSSVRNDTQVETQIPTPYIVTCIENNSFAILSYIIQRMMKSENNAELLDFYEFCLKKLSKCVKSFLKNLNSVSVLIDWWNKSLLSLHNRKDSSAYCCTKILLWIFKVIEENVTLCQGARVDNIIPILKSFVGGERLSFHSMNSGASNIASNYANTVWSIFELSLKMRLPTFFEHFEIPMVFDFMLNTFDCTRKENLIHVLRTLRYFLSFEVTLKYEETILSLMDESWKRVKEIHSTPYYNDCLKHWIEAFFQKTVLQIQPYHHKINLYLNILLELAAENGGQTFKYIIFVLNELGNLDDLFRLIPHASDILINIYCVTHADREDQRMESRTEEHIRSRSNEVSVNQIKKFDADFTSSVMRLKALNFVLKLSETEDDCLPICLKFCQSLITTNENSKTRYFNDSVIHRIKHKQLQLLLIIETIAFHKISSSYLNSLESLPKLLYDFAISSLLTKPHQPSIRYMLEWLAVRLILHYPSFFCEKFWTSFSKASEERIGSICSFISIAFHVSNVSRDENFLNLTVKFILPWTMGQHFNARLYAQTVLVKLISLSDTLEIKYEVVKDSLDSCLRKGNAVKNSIKLQQDFYFCSFHPINHFSLSMILWDLPRLSGICCEEWVTKHLYEKHLQVGSNGVIPFYHEPDLFSALTSSSWIAKAALANHYNCHESSSDAEMSLVNPTETQKKFIPFETILNAETLCLPKGRQKLIIVASLIERAPNLGGLTRTCEIFAVSQLVLNNLDVTRSKEFTSLSITAEKHVDLVEVKRQNLHDYLKKLKENEFYIVGVEQTTNSKKLEQFVFPLKSVLILGNEKEGIPASLLPFLDVCVEIPQRGVIRSLNVHVCASILIWEYSKQHSLKLN